MTDTPHELAIWMSRRQAARGITPEQMQRRIEALRREFEDR